MFISSLRLCAFALKKRFCKEWPMGRVLAVVVAVLVFDLSARGDLKEILSEPIIGPKQGMSDVQDYCEARIPSMPAVKTREEWEAVARKIRADVLDKVVFR